MVKIKFLTARKYKDLLPTYLVKPLYCPVKRKIGNPTKHKSKDFKITSKSKKNINF